MTDRELNESESHAVNELINFIVEYERIGDYAINVVERSGEMFDKEITFSESARRELSLVDNAIKEIMDITLAAFQADDTVLAEQVEPLEETIDLMIDTPTIAPTLPRASWARNPRTTTSTPTSSAATCTTGMCQISTRCWRSIS